MTLLERCGFGLVAALVGGSTFAAALPIGYRQLDWIESTGSQYINTGYTRSAAETARIELYAWTTNYFGGESARAAMYGDQNKTASRFYFCCEKSKLYHCTNVSGLQSTSGYQSGNNVIIADFTNGLITVNGTETTMTKPGNGSGAMLLFACRDSSGGAQNLAQMRLSRFIVSSTNAVVRDFVPCYRVADGCRGVMDVVNGTFCPNLGGGDDFLAGPVAPGTLEVDADSLRADELALLTAENGFSPARGQTDGHQPGETITFTAPTAVFEMSEFYTAAVSGYRLYETENATRETTLVTEGKGASCAYTYREGYTPRFVWVFAYTAKPAHTLTLTSASAVDAYLPAGVSATVDCVNGSGGRVNKTGAGTLEVQFLSNQTVRVVVEEGEFNLANPRPAVFADAYLHLDAAALASLDIETVGGTNFVNQWRDADGGPHWATNCATVWQCRTDPANRRPYLVTDGLNGRPYVDFGSLLTRNATNELGQALGYGAAMKLDATVKMAEGFTVFSDTEDYPDWPARGYSICGQTPMAHETGTGWFRRPIEDNGISAWSSDNGPCNDHFPQKSTATNLVVDFKYLGTRPKFVGPSAGFHMLRAMPEIPLSVAHLAACRTEASGSDASANRVYGGQRIAEYLLFTRTLTDAERLAASRYLWTKWFAQGLLSVTVRAGAKFTVDPDVNVTVGSFDAEPGSDVALGGGTVRLDAVNNSNVRLRLDASAADSLVTEAENGTNFVTRWCDADGRSAYAVPDLATGKWGQRSSPENRKPFITEGRTVTGLPVVDFGTPLITVQGKSTTVLEGEAVGYGGALKMSASLKAEEMLLVAEDNEAITNQVAGKDAVSYFTSVTGDSEYGGANNGRRGQTAKGKVPPIFVSVSSDGNKFYSGGTHYIDNVSVASSARPPLGAFYVLDTKPVATDPTFSFNRLARTCRTDSVSIRDCYGGMRYAEALFFIAALPEGERDRVNRILRNKWFGDAYTAVRQMANLSVAGDLTVPFESLAVTETLAVGGTLTVPKGVTAGNLTALAAGAEIVGAVTLGATPVLSFVQDGKTVSGFKAEALALPAAGTLRLTVTNEGALRGQKVRLIDCAQLTGSLDGWVREVTGYGLSVAFSVEADGLYATFGKPGLTILVQ